MNKYLQSLPEVLRADRTFYGLAMVFAEQLEQIDLQISQNIILPEVDKLSEELVDILAYDLHVDWYLDTEPLEVKKQIVKDSVNIHRKLGTKWAVEQVIRAYFGSGMVQEWWEYAGEPGRFKVISNNPRITNAVIDAFLAMLETVKRKSAHLDAILITLTGFLQFYIGIAVHETNRTTYTMMPVPVEFGPIYPYIGAVVMDTTKVTYTIGTKPVQLGDIQAKIGVTSHDAGFETHTITIQNKERNNDEQ